MIAKFFVALLSVTSTLGFSIAPPPLYAAGLQETISNVVDLFKPLYYLLELKVASKSIPNVSSISGRKTLEQNPFDANKGVAFDHSKWDAVLKRHVKVGAGTIGPVTGINMVDYAGVSADVDYKAYLEQLDRADVSKLQPAEQLAFWMNAYNALCINIIIEHEKKNQVKIKSITNLTTEGNAVWNQVAGKVGGKDVSLNEIEHEQLRKVWAEPLVHACIVCASASCPNLRPEAFVVDSLQKQMDEQMRDWMKNDTKGLKLTKNRLELSRIFLWFGADFGNWNGIQKWLPKYIDDESIKEKVARGNLSVRYFEYGWQINRA